MIECTGVGELAFEALTLVRPDGVVALAGISGSDRTYPLEADALNKRIVLENIALFGSVNANRRHYEAAASALAAADPGWLGRLITRRVPLDRWSSAMERQPEDVKTIIQIGA